MVGVLALLKLVSLLFIIIPSRAKPKLQRLEARTAPKTFMCLSQLNTEKPISKWPHFILILILSFGGKSTVVTGMFSMLSRVFYITTPSERGIDSPFESC